MKTVIVLGVGRCGSSLVAHILHTLGVYMGPTFIEANEYNKRGYWEDSTIMSIQNEMLRSIGRSWWNPPGEGETLFISGKYITDLLGVFEKRKAQAKSKGKEWWGWKDPRTHWLLPLYEEQLENPHYVFIHRDPFSIAQSVFYRDKKIVKTLDRAINIVMEHYSMLTEIIKGDVPHIHISYRDVLAEPRKIVHQIDDFLGMKASSCTITSAIDCVRPELRTW